MSLPTVYSSASLMCRSSMSLSRATSRGSGWFERCPSKPSCPKHNPTKPWYQFCKSPDPEPNPKAKCIYQKPPCARNHGYDCCCRTCMCCRIVDNYKCSTYHEDGPPCPCMESIEPHDFGCQCSECLAHTDCSNILEELESPPPQLTEEQKIIRLGEKCYCLMSHPNDCECKQCEECMFQAYMQERAERDVLRQQEQLKEDLIKQEKEHGSDCPCLKCKALRQRIQITVCNLHLATCRCWNMHGLGCKCAVCKNCLTRKRVAMVGKADDYW